ncbi:MAG: putative transporter substrate binding protein [Chloroflexi bacterium]|jgi:polar amino acid transport system substrate-binding protein|nr:putative transporter substrate binding protein [Chloroflexota bacterium]
MKKLHILASVLVVLSLLLAACGGGAETPEETQPPVEQPIETQPTEPAVAPAEDKLAEVMARGILIVSSDPAYPPQSELVPNAVRPADTKCATDQKTSAELQGFDIDVSVEIAKRLGLEACFVTPDWTLITAGNWADRWDLSVGSMTITPERMQNLFFSQPYYTTPAAFFVHTDNTSFTQPSDLSGKKIGACTGCTYDAYLSKTLSIPGEEINFIVDDAVFSGYETDSFALDDLALGDGTRLDAVLTAQPTGVQAIQSGKPLKQLGDPVYFEYLAAAIDKAHSKDPTSFVQKLTEVIQQMHADGTLLGLSQKYYGLDLTTAAGEFDVSLLGQ